MGSRGNTVMLEEFKALLEKSLTNKTDRYWLDQVGLEINDENDLCIVVSSDFIKSAIEKKVYSKIPGEEKIYNRKSDEDYFDKFRNTKKLKTKAEKILDKDGKN